ncbi:MAG: methyltransferase domain-containing protein [Actinomycetota bacterium]
MTVTSSPNPDRVMPTGKWEFDEEVTAVFEDMLARSIPDYAQMRALTTDLALRYAVRDTYIVDLGCSRGGALAPIVDALGTSCRYRGFEVSAPMREAAAARFAHLGPAYCRIEDVDLRKALPVRNASVVLSVLTLQFTPIEYRQAIVQRAFDALVPGGALLLVEKVLGSDAEMDALLVERYYTMKGEHGYTAEQIAAKRESLEGVLVPITAEWNEHLLRRAGFAHVECYWRCLNFAGWVAVRPGRTYGDGGC